MVDLALEQDRDLADEAFTMGYSLTGFYSGSWYFLFVNGDNLQVAYNVDTAELVLADDMNSSLSVIDGEPVKSLE